MEPLYIREGIFKKEIDECADLKNGCNIFVKCKMKHWCTFGYFCSALLKRIMLSVLVVSESSKKCFSKVLMLSMGRDQLSSCTSADKRLLVSVCETVMGL